MPRVTEAGLAGGVGLGRSPARPGDGPKPKGGRVSLSPPLRAAIARMHARQTYLEHVAPLRPQATLDQLAAVLTVRRVPAVRGRSGWNSKRTHDLLHRAQRAFEEANG